MEFLTASWGACLLRAFASMCFFTVFEPNTSQTCQAGPAEFENLNPGVPGHLKPPDSRQAPGSQRGDYINDYCRQRSSAQDLVFSIQFLLFATCVCVCRTPVPKDSEL